MTVLIGKLSARERCLKSLDVRGVLQARTPPGTRRFFMLNDKQILTLIHLQKDGKKDVVEILGWLSEKRSQFRYNHRIGGRAGKRKHSKKHYQGIINYLAQGNPLPELQDNGSSLPQ